MGSIPGIPLSAIERYLNLWPEHDPVYFTELILMIDDEYRGVENSRMKRERETTRLRQANK